MSRIGIQLTLRYRLHCSDKVSIRLTKRVYYIQMNHRSLLNRSTLDGKNCESFQGTKLHGLMLLVMENQVKIWMYKRGKLVYRWNRYEIEIVGQNRMHAWFAADDIHLHFDYNNILYTGSRKLDYICVIKPLQANFPVGRITVPIITINDWIKEMLTLLNKH